MTERHFRDLAIDEYFRYNLWAHATETHVPEWSDLRRKYDDASATTSSGEKFAIAAMATVLPADMPVVEEYNLFAVRPGLPSKTVRKATKVTLPGGFVVKFMDRLPRVLAIEQAEAQRLSDPAKVAEHDWPLTGIFLSTAGNQVEAHYLSHAERRVAHLVARGALYQGTDVRDGLRTDRFTVAGRALVLHQYLSAGTFHVMLEVATRNANDPEDFYRLDQAWVAARDFSG